MKWQWIPGLSVCQYTVNSTLDCWVRAIADVLVWTGLCYLLYVTEERRGAAGNTRMHSSSMHTAHLLTVFQHTLCGGGMYNSMHWARGCIASMHRAGMCVSQHALSRGVSARGVLQRGRGVHEHPPLWTEWQTGVKTLPCRNFVAGW